MGEIGLTILAMYFLFSYVKLVFFTSVGGIIVTRLDVLSVHEKFMQVNCHLYVECKQI